MSNLITKCPSCGKGVKIAALRCIGCGLELRSDFEMRPIDMLSDEQTEFLYSFLRQRGNLKSLQAELGISYPTAKKQLDDLLIALELASPELPENNFKSEEFDMTKWNIKQTSDKPSEVIKRKLAECGGTVTVYTLQKKPCEIYGSPDEFTSDKFQGNNKNAKPQKYKYKIFDIIVDFLNSRGGHAKKGNGQNRVGEPGCDKTTVAGTFAYKYCEKADGESIPNPIFVFAAMLEWAGIARNTRGELILNDEYRKFI